MNTADNKISEVLAKFGEPMAGNVWRVQGTAVIYHKTLERIAAQAKVVFDEPKIIRAERDEAVIQVTGRMGERADWSIGEALIGVNYRVSGKQAAYVYAMAEKRAKDRVILKLIELHGYVYSEEEADEFKQARPGFAEQADDDGPSPAQPDRPVPVDPPDSDALLNAPSGSSAPDAHAPRPDAASPGLGAPPGDEEPLDFERVLSEIRDHLVTATEEKHVEEIEALYRDDYERMTRSQRSVVDGDYLSARERIERASRSPAATGEDNDATLIFDAALCTAMELTAEGDAKLADRIKRAVEATTTVEDADKLFALMKQTGQRRKAIKSESLRDEIYMLARAKLDQFDGK